MRIVNKFKYKNKIFRAGELTVGDYLIFLEDAEYFIEKVLSEFNPTTPKLSADQLKKFLDILFDRKDIDKLFPKKQTQSNDDFHVVLGIFMKNMHQGYEDVCKMPMRLFNKMLQDMECIIDPIKYDPKRNDIEPDRKKLRETLGNKTEIKS